MKNLLPILLLPFLIAAQTPSPCTDWAGYGPDDVPFVYDSNQVLDKVIGWWDIIGGQPTSCSVNVCSEPDEPITLTLLNAPNDVLLENWRLVWPTKKTDVGVHYVHLQARASVSSFGTVIYNIKHDNRPKFGPIEKHQAKLPKYYADLADKWLKQ